MLIAKRQYSRLLRIVVLGVQLVRAARYGAFDHFDGRKCESDTQLWFSSTLAHLKQATFMKRLDHFFNAGYYLAGNEPSFQVRCPRASARPPKSEH